MNSIDQKVVEMKFDNSQFESAVSQTMSTLEKFKDKLNFKGTEKGFDKLGKSASNYQYTLQDVGQSLANLEKRFSVMGTIGGRVFEKLTDSAYGFLTRGIGNIFNSISQGGLSRAMNLEQAKFQLDGILKDAKLTHRVIYDDILPELQGTPFSLDQAAVVISQLVSSGKDSSEQIKRATRGMAGLAAMSGHSFEEVGRIYTKVAGNGVLMAEELNQLSGYSINAAAALKDFYKMVEKNHTLGTPQTIKDMKAIKEAYGEFTEETIREAASKRMIHYGSMAAAMDVLYGEHAQKSTEMYKGALEDVKAALARTGAEVAELRLSTLRDAFNALVPAIDAVNAVINPFLKSTDRLYDGFEDVPEYLRPFKGSLARDVQKLGWAFQGLFVQMDDNNEIIRANMKTYEKLGFELRTSATGVRTFYDAVNDIEYDEKQALMNPKMLATITAGTKSFVNIVTALGKVLNAVGSGIKMAFPKVSFDQVVAITEQVQKFTSKLILGHKELERIRWFTRGLFTPLGLAIRGLVGFIDLLIRAFKSLSKVLTPILSVFNAFMGMIGHVISGFGNMIRNFASVIKGNIADATKEIRGAEIWGKILSKVTTFCSILAQNLDRAGVKAYAFLTHLHQLPAVQASLSSMGTIVGGIKDAFDAVTKAVGNFIKKIGLGDKLASFTGMLSDFFSSQGDKMSGSLGQFGDWFSKFGFYKSAIDLLTGSFSGLIGVIGGLAKFKPLKGLRKWFAELGELIISVGKSFLEGDFFVDRAKELFDWFGNYRKLGGRLKNGFVPAIKALGDSLPKLLNFKGWGDMLEAIGNKIGAAVGFILKTLGLFGTGAVQDAAKGVENLSKVTSSISASAKDLGNSQYIAPMKMFFEEFGGSFKDWAKNIDVQSAKRLVIGLAYFATCLYYLNTLNTAAKAFRGLAIVAKNISGVAGAIGRMISAIADIPTALRGVVLAVKSVAYMHALAVALIGIAASMYIISMIDPNRLAASAGIAVGLLVVVSGLMLAINKVANKLGPDTAKTMLTVAGVIGSLALATLAIAGSLYLLTTIKDPKALEKAVQSIASIIVIFGLVMGGLSVIPLFTKGKKLKGAFGNISSAAWALVGISAGIRSMIEAIRDLAELYQNGDEESIKKAVDLVTQLIVITGVFAALAGWGQHGFASGMAIIPMALGLKLIIGSIVDLANSLKDTASLDRAMTALDGLGKFVSNLAWLFIAIGAMNALSGLISKGGFILSGNKGMGGALIAIAEVIAGVWVVSQSIMKLGTLTDAQIENGIKVLKAFGILVGVISAISYFGGYKVASGAGSFAALATGLFLLAEGIVALGETEHFAAGFGRMGVALLGLIGSVVLATKLISSFMTVQQAASIALLSAAMLGFALSIRMMAECPWESLMFAVIGLVGTMAIAAGVMTAFAAAGPALLPIAGVFALLGIAALGLGAGVFLLTLALSALIPLITGLGKMPMDQLKDGLEVLKVAAAGLCETFEIMAGGIVTLAGSFLLLGVALVVAGIGGAALGVGLVAISAGVFLLAGSLIVLYETLSAFFPSVVKPVENSLSALTNLFASEMQRSADAARYGISDMDIVVNEEGDKMASDANAKGEETADNLNPANHMDSDNIRQEIADKLGIPVSEIPEEMGNLIDANSDEFTGSLGDMLGEGNTILSNGSLGTGTMGFDYISNYAGGIDSGADLPVNSTDIVMRAMKEKLSSFLPGWRGQGAAQMQKLTGGMKSGEDDVEKEANIVGNKAVPPSKYEASKKVGEGICDGIIAGLKSGSDLVYKIAYNAGDRAVQGTKDGADVNSPSKKTIPVGSAIGEGLIVGMQNIAGQVVNSASDLASKGIDALTAAMLSSSSVFDSDLDFNPTITPVVDLTGVRESVNGINSMFGRDFGINPYYSGGMNAAFAASSFMDSRNQNARNSELAKLTDSIYGMTDTMNSRSLNNYITIEGSEDPSLFADELVRSFKLNARTI